MSREEKELLRRARKGDAVAVGGIVRRYLSLVHTSALPVVRDPSGFRNRTHPISTFHLS